MSRTLNGDEAVDPAEAVREIAPWARHDPWCVITCEHATNRMPPGWQWPEEDRWLVDTHWASDLHIEAFVEGLARRLRVPAVLSRFTRLLVDPNRPMDADTLFREVAEGRPVVLNQDLTEDEKARRIRHLYDPYHHAADRLVWRSPGASVLGVHSFTDTYEGTEREVEIGVLFDEDEALATAFAEHVRGHGFEVRLNEPYSGKQGLIFGPRRHARNHGRACIELELRQDRLEDPVTSSRLVEIIAGAAEATLRPLYVPDPEG